MHVCMYIVMILVIELHLLLSGMSLSMGEILMHACMHVCSYDWGDGSALIVLWN